MDKIPDLFSAMLNENPKYFPAPPKELVEFRALDKYVKIQNGEKFYKQEFIQTYLEDKWKIEVHNHDTFLWAYEVYKSLPDGENKDKVEVKLKQFKTAIEKQDHPYPSLMIDFTKYPFTSSMAPVGALQVDWND